MYRIFTDLTNKIWGCKEVKFLRLYDVHMTKTCQKEPFLIAIRNQVGTTIDFDSMTKCHWSWDIFYLVKKVP